MPTTIAGRSEAHWLAQSTGVPLIVWCLAGVALIAGLDLAVEPMRLQRLIGDSDDANRLMQVRALLAGSPWTDTTLARLGGATPLVSHWSRLVDLPIATLISLLSLFLKPETAELAARFSWPLIVLTGMLALMARSVAERADRAAAVTAVFLAVTALTAMNQFMPGRIDHHNAMVLGAVGGLLLLARSLRSPRSGWVAGMLLGIGTAVGYEALLLTVTILALANLQALATGRGGEGVWRASVAFAGTLAAALVVTTAPSRLLVSHCDALSLNLVLLATCAAVGSLLALRVLEGSNLAVRLAALAGAGAVGLVVYAGAEPVCLKGPFGEVDPAAVPVWLDLVLETQSIAWMISSTPVLGVVAVIFVSGGGAAAVWLALKERSDASTMLAAVTVVALAFGFWQLKFLPYATLLAVVALAVVIARLAAAVPHWSGLVRFVATIAVSQITLMSLVQPGLSAAGLDKPEKRAVMKVMSRCLESASLAALSGLAPGRVVGDIDLGPFIVATTGLDAVAAPYHRIGSAIAAVDRVMYGDEAQAEAQVRRLGGTYVVICPGLATGLVKPVPKSGLRAGLMAGRTPAWLEAVELAGSTPIKVWRVKAAD